MFSFDDVIMITELIIEPPHNQGSTITHVDRAKNVIPDTTRYDFAEL